MQLKGHDVFTLALIALVAVLPLIAAAPAQYGLSSVAGAWVGLLAVAVGAISGIVLNSQDKLNDGK